MRDRLGNDNTQDPILKARLDSILVHAGGEAKSTMELPHRALGDPVLGPLLLLAFAAFRSFANLSFFPRNTGFLGLVVFDGNLEAGVMRHFARDATAGRVGVVGGIFAVDATLDDESVGVGELDVDVFLFDAGKLALEFVGVLVLADVEFGMEGADGGRGRGSARVLAGVVVDETEEWSQFTRWEAREERHGTFEVPG